MTDTTQYALNILLADDDSDDRYFLEKALKTLPIATDLKIVTDGGQLMNYLSKNTAYLPDVLFLDLNMPCKNGAECLKEIKRNEELKQIPVIIYSTFPGNDLADILYQNDAHYYLQKCNFTELTQHILTILSLLSESAKQPSRNKFIIQLRDDDEIKYTI